MIVLQIIGIVFACIGGFIAFAAVTPFRYRADVSYHGSPDVDVRANWLLGLLRIFVTYTGDKPRILVKLLFFTVFDSTKPKKKKKKRKKNKKKRKRTGKKITNKDDNKPFELEADDEDELTEKSFKDKFIAVVEKIIGFFKAAGEKLELIAEWLDEDHRRLYGFLWTNGLKIFNKVKPKSFEADIAGGTGDPSSTGMIVSAASIGLGLAGIDTVRIEPDFENKRIDADVAATGYFFVFPVILIALRIYRNRDFRRFILKK